MAEIPLTQGKVALIDDEDYEWLMQWKWHYCEAGYAVRYAGGGRKHRKDLYMHRAILDVPDSLEIHHINHNGLDNRQDNILTCTHRQNLKSQRKPSRRKYSSQYKGVTFCKTGRRNKRWVAQIKCDYKHRFLGFFHTESEAAFAYDEAARTLFGKFALTNF